MNNKSAWAFDGLHSAHYHGVKGWLGSTSLKTLAKQPPARWLWESQNQVHNDYFDFGNVSHSVILEGNYGNLREIKAPNWLTKAAKEARDQARAEGYAPLLSKDVEKIRAMREAIMQNTDAARLLTGHVAERSYFATLATPSGPFQGKCRPDLFHPFQGTIGDLKTVASADPKEFARTAYNLGYHQSAAWYQDVVEAVTGFKPRFVFLLIEKEAPYLSSVVELDAEFVAWGRAENDRAIRIYRECAENDRWPGFAPVSNLAAPLWAVREMESLNE